MFGDQEETYSASLWLWDSTKGVIVLGGHRTTIEEAEVAMATYTGLDLTWTREHIEDGTTTYAAKTWERRVNLAVISRVETGDVVSHTPLPKGWLPKDHPRRKG